MADYRNDNGGTVVLPDGREIAAGETVEISAEVAKLSGVAALIEAGGLVLAKAEKQGKAE